MVSKNELTRRDFLKKSGQTALAVGCGLTANSLLTGCATVGIESQSDVAQIEWETNPAIPVPKGCYVGWYTDMVQRVRAPYMTPFNEITSTQSSQFLDFHINKFGFLPKVFCFTDEGIGHHMLDFPIEICKGIDERGVIPMLRFYHYPTFSKIVSGAYDDRLKTFCEGANSYGKPFFLDMFPEINLPGKWSRHPWADCKPSEFVNAYHRIHDVFEEEGANKHAVKGIHLFADQNFFPLSHYKVNPSTIDYIGFSVFKVALTHHTSSTVNAMFNNAYYWASSTYPTKPIALWEFGGGKGHQTSWLINAYKQIRNKPRIKLVVYTESDFDHVIGSGWAGLTDSTRLLEEKTKKAYAQALSDPYFQKVVVSK